MIQLKIALIAALFWVLVSSRILSQQTTPVSVSISSAEFGSPVRIGQFKTPPISSTVLTEGDDQSVSARYWFQRIGISGKIEKFPMQEGAATQILFAHRYNPDFFDKPVELWGSSSLPFQPR